MGNWPKYYKIGTSGGDLVIIRGKIDVDLSSLRAMCLYWEAFGFGFRVSVDLLEVEKALG